MLGILAAATMAWTTMHQTTPPAPLSPLPSARQLAWHKLEYYAFVHFGPNTFYEQEWGSGKEDPKRFNPTSLDCEQWVKTFKAAGMSAVILTGKHHDGLALWPSKFSTHTIARTSWKGGKGDVVKELSDACRRHGLKFGIYVSPWDRNHPTYGTPQYNDVFVNMLEEVLTNYGELCEVWFDGANGEGPNGKRQIYDWPRFYDTVRRLQPDACIFSDGGPDIRWVGNEAGYSAPTSWAMLERDRFFPGSPHYRELTEGHETGTHWVPAECDVSIRPGWFYRATEDHAVKTVKSLMEIYFGSVGQNGSLLLNVPPDKRGRIHEIDAKRLAEFRAARHATFALDLAKGARLSASSVRGNSPQFAAKLVADASPDTYWATNDDVKTAWIAAELSSPRPCNIVVLEEPIALGQRIRRFTIEALVNGRWLHVFDGTTIGHRRIARFPAVVTKSLRVNILDSRACPLISRLGVYCSPPEVTIDTDGSGFIGSTIARLGADVPGATIRYTLDGKEPTAKSSAYIRPLTITKTCTLRAKAFLAGGASIYPATLQFKRYSAAELLPAVVPAPPIEPGLLFDYFEGEIRSTRDLQNLQPIRYGVANELALSDHRPENFGFRYVGLLRVDRDGVYTFTLGSDDGSRLTLHHGKMIIDHDGLHGMESKAGSVALRRGLHPILVEYFNATGGLGLSVTLSGPGRPAGRIRPTEIFHEQRPK